MSVILNTFPDSFGSSNMLSAPKLGPAKSTSNKLESLYAADISSDRD